MRSTTMQRLQRHGDSYFVPIPKDIIERLGFREGDTVMVDVTAAAPESPFSPEDQRRIDRILEESQEALRYLADHES